GALRPHLRRERARAWDDLPHHAAHSGRALAIAGRERLKNYSSATERFSSPSPPFGCIFSPTLVVREAFFSSPVADCDRPNRNASSATRHQVTETPSHTRRAREGFNKYASPSPPGISLPASAAPRSPNRQGVSYAAPLLPPQGSPATAYSDRRPAARRLLPRG